MGDRIQDYEITFIILPKLKPFSLNPIKYFIVAQRKPPILITKIQVFIPF